jgi:RNA polymerase sigma-70 factor (ECF subfamily)
MERPATQPGELKTVFDKPEADKMMPDSPQSRIPPLENGRHTADKAVSRLMPAVYDELRRLARHYLRRERPGQSLQATALVNEAYLRLKKDKRQPWQNRTHFFAIAATSMRQILVERARARNAAKRGGEQVRITLDDAVAAGGEKSLDLLALDEALARLAGLDPEQARLVELRFFAGLSIEESAEALGVSPATVKREWTMARAWLKRELQKEGTRGA